MKVVFPGSDPWYTLKSGDAVAPAVGTKGTPRVTELPVDIYSMPVFVRGGSIIPRKDRARRSSSRMEFDPYTLVCVVPSPTLFGTWQTGGNHSLVCASACEGSLHLDTGDAGGGEEEVRRGCRGGPEDG